MNMKVNPFSGLGVALVTPFTNDNRIDYDRLETLADRLIRDGADFICVLGTTAETPCLTLEEKRAVIHRVKQVNGGRVPLLLGAGGNYTAQVIQYIEQEDLSGIDGLLIVAPYYNKPSQEGLYQHFRSVAAATTLPVVLYNVPGRTGVNIEAATTLRVAKDCPNVVAIKEASGRIAQIEEVVTKAPAGFQVLSGDDGITFELLTLGAVGVISVVANAYPTCFSRMVHALTDEQEDTNTALQIHRKLRPAFALLSVDGNPAGIKALLAVQGKIENKLRLPLVPARTETIEALKAFNEGFSLS